MTAFTPSQSSDSVKQYLQHLVDVLGDLAHAALRGAGVEPAQHILLVGTGPAVPRSSIAGTSGASSSRIARAQFMSRRHAGPVSGSGAMPKRDLGDEVHAGTGHVNSASGRAGIPRVTPHR
jgi:hypothetical protein